MADSLEVYQKASSAKVNWEKSGALQLGNWGGGTAPSLPGGLRWEREGFKCLGVFLGTEEFQKRNWEGLLEKVCARMSKWKWLLPQLSYRGRVLVANNLIASMLWHRLVILPPPPGLIEEIQRALVNFFWSGQHWIKAAALYLPVREGGQGLIDIPSRVRAFRLQTAQRLLYHFGVSWADTARLLLRRGGQLGYDKHLFLLKPEEIDLTGLTPFYHSVMKAWQVLRANRVPDATPGMWLFEEPLFHNDFIVSRVLSSASVRNSLREAGCVKLGHLLKATRTSVEELGERAGIRSSRRLQMMVKEVRGSLPGPYRAFIDQQTVCDQWDDEGEYVFPALTVSAAVEDWQEDGGFLSFTTPELEDFEDTSKKAVYLTCVKVAHRRSLGGMKASRWDEFFGPGSTPKGSWRSLYKPPVEKRVGDLQWRIVHGGIATNGYLAHLDPSNGVGCPFCRREETVFHLFVECPRLDRVLAFAEGVATRLGESFSLENVIFGPKYSSSRRPFVTLVNFLYGTVKLSIWKTRKNQVKGLGSVDPLLMAKGIMSARIKIEQA